MKELEGGATSLDESISLSNKENISLELVWCNSIGMRDPQASNAVQEGNNALGCDSLCTSIYWGIGLLIGDGPTCPCKSLRTHLRTCPFYVPGHFLKIVHSPKSFEDICPVFSFLEDII